MAWTWQQKTGVVEWTGETAALLDTLEKGLRMAGYTHIEGLSITSHDGRWYRWVATVRY